MTALSSFVSKPKRLPKARSDFDMLQNKSALLKLLNRRWHYDLTQQIPSELQKRNYAKTIYHFPNYRHLSLRLRACRANAHTHGDTISTANGDGHQHSTPYRFVD